MAFLIDITPLDTLTVKIFRDKHGPSYKGNEPELFGAYVGNDLVTGVGGFGKTPLLSLQDLCENIATDEGYFSDNKKIFIR